MMADPIPIRRPVNWQNLRSDEAERIIRERAKVTMNVIIVGHPEEQSEGRSILLPDIYRILQTGHVLDPPTRIDQGEWEAVIRIRMKGTRDAGAVTIILTGNEMLIVKTVMWIDQ